MVEMDLTEFREAAVGFGNKYIYEGIRNKIQTDTGGDASSEEFLAMLRGKVCTRDV